MARNQLKHSEPQTVSVSTTLEPSEQELFLQAMAEVKPLHTRKRAPRNNGCLHHVREIPKDEGLMLLNAFVEGRSEFDWSFHPDYQEGGAEHHNRPLLRKLRKGRYAVQAELDLHGLNQSEAFAALQEFLEDSFNRRLRCVRVIHGKGKNSQDNVGVLKRNLPKWLSIRRLSRMVIAFTSAPPIDGGVGATYILLRKSASPVNGQS